MALPRETSSERWMSVFLVGAILLSGCLAGETGNAPPTVSGPEGSVGGLPDDGAQNNGWRIYAAPNESGPWEVIAETEPGDSEARLRLRIPVNTTHLEGRYGPPLPSGTLRVIFHTDASTRLSTRLGLVGLDGETKDPSWTCVPGSGEPAFAGEGQGYGFTVRPEPERCTYTLVVGDSVADAEDAHIAWDATLQDDDWPPSVALEARFGEPHDPGFPEECPARDCSRQTWRAVIQTAQGGGAFSVAIPVPVGATPLEDWLANATIQGNADLEAVDTPNGSAILVQGNGPVIVQSHDFRAATPLTEEYLDAYWSTRANDTRPTEVPVRVDGELSRLELSYEASSRFCGRFATFETGRLQGDGKWVELPGEDLAECQ